jgi:hypothetical protein
MGVLRLASEHRVLNAARPVDERLHFTHIEYLGPCDDAGI